MTRVLALLILLGAMASAHAQNDADMEDFARNAYANMEDSIHREYTFMVMSLPVHATGRAASKVATMREALKMLTYNRAALFAFCAADAERARPPNAPRIPAQRNLLLTTCVEQKSAELNDFNNKVSYAGIFFPERITRCEEAARLRDREKLLPPYAFLEMDEPRLYDFARYNRCLMQPY